MAAGLFHILVYSVPFPAGAFLLPPSRRGEGWARSGVPYAFRMPRSQSPTFGFAFFVVIPAKAGIQRTLLGCSFAVCSLSKFLHCGMHTFL